MRALTRQDLDFGRCDVPGCDHSGHDTNLHIYGRCHPQGTITACYSKATGAITFRCAECSALIVEVKVAAS